MDSLCTRQKRVMVSAIGAEIKRHFKLSMLTSSENAMQNDEEANFAGTHNCGRGVNAKGVRCACCACCPHFDYFLL